MTHPTVQAIRSSPAERDGAGKRVLHRRHPWRVVSAIVAVVLVAVVIRSAATNPRFEWHTVGHYFFEHSIVQGLTNTIWLTAVSMVFAILIGIILALMVLSSNPVLRAAAKTYIWFFRGTPLLVQLIFLYNLSALYPQLALGIPGGPSYVLPINDILSTFVVALLGLSLNEGAYMAEIVRGGILSVDAGQSRAAEALGLPAFMRFRYIVLPQAMKVIIPPTGNQVIAILKFTSLLSVIAVPELLFSAQLIYSRTYEVIPLLIVACTWYLIIVTLLTAGQAQLEAYFGNSPKRSWHRRLRQNLFRSYGDMAGLNGDVDAGRRR